MSYEGYDMYLCVNGHQNSYDCLDDNPTECEDCGAAIAWTCSVDQTNDAGVFPVLVEHEPAQVETCECCGHTKVVAEETYAIPSNAGRLLEAADDRTVPVVNVKFQHGNSDKAFDTKDEAWKSTGRWV